MIYPLPTYPPTMRSHFDVDRFKKLISHDLDFDLIFSHLQNKLMQLKTLCIISLIIHLTSSDTAIGLI